MAGCSPITDKPSESKDFYKGALGLPLKTVIRVVIRPGASPVDGEGLADLSLDGDAVELLEALSIRRPLDAQVDAANSWMVDGLLEVFNQSRG